MAKETQWLVTNNPMSWFPGYRVVVFKTPGEGFDIFEIDAANDEEALERARIRAGRSAFELWDAAVMVGRYDPDS